MGLRAWFYRRRIRSWIHRRRLLVWGVMIVIFGAFFYSLNVSINALSCKEFIIRYSSEWAVAFGTLFLAYATAELAMQETDQSRADRRFAKAERIRLRLKEQLEGLYSPLMAHVDDFKSDVIYTGSSFEMLLKEIRWKYEYLANPEFAEEMRNYFYEYRYDFKTPRLYGWDKFIQLKIQLLKKDHKEILKKYLDLVSSGS